MINPVPITDFKANYRRIIERAQNNRQQVTLTKNGKPIATIIPSTTKKAKTSLSGLLIERATINGDIINTAVLWETDDE